MVGYNANKEVLDSLRTLMDNGYNILKTDSVLTRIVQTNLDTVNYKHLVELVSYMVANEDEVLDSFEEVLRSQRSYRYELGYAVIERIVKVLWHLWATESNLLTIAENFAELLSILKGSFNLLQKYSDYTVPDEVLPVMLYNNDFNFVVEELVKYNAEIINVFNNNPEFFVPVWLSILYLHSTESNESNAVELHKPLNLSVVIRSIYEIFKLLTIDCGVGLISSGVRNMVSVSYPIRFECSTLYLFPTVRSAVVYPKVKVMESATHLLRVFLNRKRKARKLDRMFDEAEKVMQQILHEIIRAYEKRIDKYGVCNTYCISVVEKQMMAGSSSTFRRKKECCTCNELWKANMHYPLVLTGVVVAEAFGELPHTMVKLEKEISYILEAMSLKDAPLFRTVIKECKALEGFFITCTSNTVL